MKWVTRERVKVDRVACPWLIRKFVDPQAEFLFVPADQVLAVAEREGATPFDVPGVELGHHGKECSFDAIVKKYDLEKDAALHRIAAIIDEADTVQEASVEPAAAGLDLICRGLRRTSPNDQVALERGAMVYDALYAELGRDRGEAERSRL